MIRILHSKDACLLLARKEARFTEAEAVVRPILEAVRKRGDRALLEYAARFDGFSGRTVKVAESELLAASRNLEPDFRSAVRTAARNIRRYAARQMPRPWTTEFAPGLRLGQIVRPLDTVAAYIPSGRYPLPSTVLMTVVPAQVAGVPNVCVSSPRPVAEILGTAGLLKVTNFFQMGGAHAIAAFAYGTKTVPRADRIVGPGNIYVAAAKKILAGEVGIDFVAGPTEILIISEEGDPRHLAADMLAQAEHDVDASAVLLTTSKRLAAAVAKELDRQLATLPTKAVARRSIARNSAVILVSSLDEAIDLSNRFAPEHLSIPSASLLDRVKHAGQRFRRPVQSGGRGRLCRGTESRSAHQRRSAHPGRTRCHRLSEGDFGAGAFRFRSREPRARCNHTRPGRRPGSPRTLRGGSHRWPLIRRSLVPQ